MSTFLRSKIGTALPLSIVMGNSTCDLDSIASSIAYAYYMDCHVEPAVPVVCIPKEDLILRTEVTFLFNLLDIHVDDLMYLDSVEVKDIQGRHTKVHLVDHNKYDNSILNLQSYEVASIIDHHVDEMGPCTGYKRIEMVGSCASLITSLFKEKASEDPPLSLSDDMRQLLAATILLDTINLDFEKGRTTEMDVQMFEFLSVPDRLGLYQMLIAAKTDISKLTVSDLLRRDCKSFPSEAGPVFISSITGATWKQFSSMENVVEETNCFVSKHEVGVFVVMLAFHGAGARFRRFLAVPHGADLLGDDGIASIVDRLNLSEIKRELSGMSEWLVYEQMDVKSSRKVVLPLFKSLLNR